MTSDNSDAATFFPNSLRLLGGLASIGDCWRNLRVNLLYGLNRDDTDRDSDCDGCLSATIGPLEALWPARNPYHSPLRPMGLEDWQVATACCVSL
jgi:hypothetical protein